MSSTSTPDEELAALAQPALNVPERNWTRWAKDEQRKLYVVFPEVPDKELDDTLAFAHRLYGSDHVVVGDVFNEEHPWVGNNKPGVGIYVTLEGLAYAEQRWLHGKVALASLRLSDRLDVAEAVMRRHGLKK